MSVLLSIMFIGLSGVAVLAIAEAVGRSSALIADLLSTLREPPETVEVRLTVQEQGPRATTSQRRRGRHLHHPKPISHRLHGRSKRSVVA